ncbi:hypothetical protein Tco_0725302 [Tanacetum coccineum]|uniref:Reverse transcriptase domain-containing protein n=1 Tax=Tanacetum coccineum TaxID=301880 RepID=A0ABQ4YEN5_9ASTR
MAERTMEELLRAPTEGYGEAIVLPEINADHFEIKTNLLQLVQANPFYGRESENPHAHINSFKRIISTLRFRNVANDVIKLMMFQYSEAWERFKELLRACPHHGFTELTQVDPFTMVLNEKDNQDSLNVAGEIKSNIWLSSCSIPEPDVSVTTLPKNHSHSGIDIQDGCLPKPNISYPSRRDDQKSRDKASNQMEKIFQIFQDLRFDISFADALLWMPRFAPTIKSLPMNKEKLLELAKIPLS